MGFAHISAEWKEDFTALLGNILIKYQKYGWDFNCA